MSGSSSSSLLVSLCRQRLSHHHLLLLFLCLLSSLLRTSYAQNCPTSPDSPLTPENCTSGQTFNPETGCCHSCRSCSGREMLVLSICNATHDTVCGCETPFFLDTTDNQCHLNCNLCPRSCSTIRGVTRCNCNRPSCHPADDLYCRHEILYPCRETVAPPTEPTRPPPEMPGIDGPNSLPPWGIGLIAVAIVIGIILFASCFLCMGIFSKHKSREPESHQGSETSENGLVPRDSFASVGTTSTYASSNMYPYLSSHSMLELLKNSNSQLVLGGGGSGGEGSLHGSPISSRASPKPVRTVMLAKSADSDKLTAIVL